MLCLGLGVEPSEGFGTQHCMKFRYKMVEMVKSLRQVLEYKDVFPPESGDPMKMTTQQEKSKFFSDRQKFLKGKKADEMKGKRESAASPENPKKKSKRTKSETGTKVPLKNDQKMKTSKSKKKAIVPKKGNSSVIEASEAVPLNLGVNHGGKPVLRVQPVPSQNSKDWELALHSEKKNSKLKRNSRLVQEVVNLLSERVPYSGDSSKENYFNSQIKMNGAFYAKKGDSLVAAMIVAQYGLFFHRRKAMIIKHIAVKKKHDGFDFGRFLLFKFAQVVLKNDDVDVFAYVQSSTIREFDQWKETDFKESHLHPEPGHVQKLKNRRKLSGFFQRCGFVLDSPPEKNFGFSKNAAVPDNCNVMRASSSFLCSILTSSKAQVSTKMCDINPHMFNRLRFVKADDTLQAHNVYFGWKNVKAEDLENVSKKEICWCNENPGETRSLRSGLRDPSISAPQLGNRVSPIHPMLQGRNASLGDCMWRAAALIVFLTSESDAKKMLELLDKDWQCFL